MTVRPAAGRDGEALDRVLHVGDEELVGEPGVAVEEGLGDGAVLAEAHVPLP